MSANGGDRVGLLEMARSVITAPFEERALRARRARMETLRVDAATRVLQEVVRRVEPEDDGFQRISWPLKRQLDETESLDLREAALEASLTSPHLIGYLKSLKRFVLGKGPTFRPLTEDEALAEQLDAHWRTFADLNDWDSLEDEIAIRTWRDGEVFVRRHVQRIDGPVFQGAVSAAAAQHLSRLGLSAAGFRPPTAPRGMVFLRIIPPEHVRDPGGVISHGILTAEQDVQTVLAYCWTPDANAQRIKELIEAVDVLHIKVRVDGDVKRGRTLFEPLLQLDKYHRDWLRYRLALNLARTAIVLVKTIEGSPDQIRTLRNAQETDRESPGQENRVKMLRPMTTVHATPGVKYEFLAPNLHATDARVDGRNILLAMAAATGLPEYMFTGDASNSNFACHDDQTEILTRRGWLRQDALCVDDEVATRSPEGCLAFQRPLAIHRHEYHGPMVAIEGQHFDMLVTPNHRLWLSGTRDGSGRFVEAGALQPARSYALAGFEPAPILAPVGAVALPEVPYQTHPELDPGERCVEAEAWARFVGLWVAEGSALHARRARATKFMVTVAQKQPAKLPVCEAILRATPFRWRRSGAHWYTFDKSLWSWLVAHCGRSSGSKRIPRSILEGDSVVQRAFFEGAMIGDGHRSKLAGRTVMTYSTSSSQLADEMQRLTLELGYLCRRTGPYRPTGWPGYPVSNPVYMLRLRRQVPLTLRRRAFSTRPYRGIVWCVTVPNGLILTRRNGYPAVHGNSTMVSEAPAIREFEDWQDFFTPRYRRIWRWVMEAAAEANAVKGLRIEDLRSGAVDVEVAWPPMVARDELKEAQRDQILQQAGVLSDEGLALRAGVDWKTEHERLVNERDAGEWGAGRLVDMAAKLLTVGGLTVDSGLENRLREILGVAARIEDQPLDDEEPPPPPPPPAPVGDGKPPVNVDVNLEVHTPAVEIDVPAPRVDVVVEGTPQAPPGRRTVTIRDAEGNVVRTGEIEPEA